MFFFCFTFHYWIFLKVNLHCFIQFPLYRFFPTSQVSHKFDMLTWVKYFYPFLNGVCFSILLSTFNLLITELLDFFLFFLSLWSYLILINFLLCYKMKFLKPFKMYFFIILTSVYFFRLVIAIFFISIGFCLYNHVIKLTRFIELIQINNSNPQIFFLLL